jgi:lipopolysaccharide biosynthesis glycosyltransferase
MKVFIGWDSREDIAYQVCKHSIVTRTESNVEIIPIIQKDLRKQGLYTRHHDVLSSTEFTFTRFFVPYLTKFEGWALFCDCDFLFLDDVKKLFDLAEKNHDKAVMVVKHDYNPEQTMKMDGKVQYPYPRKNWSSLILWNCAHPKNSQLTPDILNIRTGAWLHRFQWLNDEDIGDISVEWNWLVNWYHEPTDGSPKALHYTEGGPWFDHYMKTEYGAHWIKEKYEYLMSTEKKAEPEVVMAPSKYDNLPEQIYDVFDDILKYRVDPSGSYYEVKIDNITEKIKQLDTKTIMSTDSEFRFFEKKGLMYDPILQNFVLGAGGQISTWDNVEKSNGPVVLRGITKRKQMAILKEQGRDFFYVDTGYFGNGRKKLFHRVTKNNMQNLGPVIERPMDRLQAAGVRLSKFRGGRNILLCPPSAKVMVFYNLDLDEWLKTTVETIKKYTDRPIIIRLKQGRSVRATTDTMEMALQTDIHCLVTFNSIAATEALLLGKPAFTLGPNAAQSLCKSNLAEIENPYIPTLDEVGIWAAHLAYSQFTEAEMRSGLAWKILNEV